jgi:hypothetical protein
MTALLKAPANPRVASIVLVFMRLALAATLFAGLTRTIADADLWGHLLFGRDILLRGTLPSHDTYSFTSNIPWINHEWLAEVIAYWAYATGSTALLVAVKSALLLSMMALVLVSLRRVAHDPVVHDLLMFLAVAGTYGRSLTFRPQVFSLMLFPALLLTLLSAERGRPKALLAVPAIFVLWANLHGGWIVGLGALGIWLAWNFVRPDAHGVPRPWLAAIGAAALLATLANPYGVKLWDFLRETVGISRQIVDWQPMWNLPFILYTPWLTTTFLAAGALLLERRRVDPAHAAIVVMCWAGSVRVNRLDAFFVLGTVMLLAPAIRTAFRRVAASSRPMAAPSVARPGTVALAAVAIGIAGSTAGRANFGCIVIDEQWAPEREAVMFAKANRLQGRMLTFFDWGEYAIWHLSPDIKVSIDGRRETVYSEDLFEDHMRLYANTPGSAALVQRLQPDLVWLPEQVEVLKVLEQAGWSRVFTGSKSAILTRSPLETRALQRVAQPPARCFPGP